MPTDSAPGDCLRTLFGACLGGRSLCCAARNAKLVPSLGSAGASPSLDSDRLLSDAASFQSRLAVDIQIQIPQFVSKSINIGSLERLLNLIHQQIRELFARAMQDHSGVSSRELFTCRSADRFRQTVYRTLVLLASTYTKLTGDRTLAATGGRIPPSLRGKLGVIFGKEGKQEARATLRICDMASRFQLSYEQLSLLPNARTWFERARGLTNG